MILRHKGGFAHPTVTDTNLPSQHRAGQGMETEQTVNSEALEIEQYSNERQRLNNRNNPKSRPGIRPTPSSLLAYLRTCFHAG